MDDRKQRKNHVETGKDIESPQFIPPHAVTPEVLKERQCPICWGNYGGIGISYHGGILRHYRCNQCGHTWTFDQRKQVIRYKVEEKIPK